MGGSTLHKLTLVCLVSSTVPAASALSVAVSTAKRVGLLAAREDVTCGGNAALQHCGEDLPSGFCCPAKSTCMRLHNTGTDSVLCCPEGQSCDFIQTITCDIALQDADRFPGNPLHTADLSLRLPSCGTQCCPLGYDCKDDKCVLKEETKAPSSTSGSSPAPTAPSTAAPESSSPTSIPDIAVAPRGSGFSGSSFAAGLFPGLLLGALTCFLVLWYLRRRKRRESVDSIFGPVRRDISEPIHRPSMSHRTDFLQAHLHDSIRSSDTGKSPAGGHSPEPQPYETTPTPRPRYHVTEDTDTMSRGSVPRVRALFAPRSPASASRPRMEHRASSQETIGVLMSPPQIVPSRFDAVTPTPASAGSSHGGNGRLHPNYGPRTNVEREIDNGQRLTTFTTIMHDAGYTQR